MNTKYKLIIFGITGDCPALSLIVNFINHNGYYSCWFCYIEGEHVNHRHQFRYSSIRLRSKEHFRKLSAKAERNQLTILGHHGQNVLEDVLDVQFPDAIVLDYLHVSLLGFAKSMILLIYQQLKPKQRDLFNSQLANQSFPRIFSNLPAVFDLQFLFQISSTENYELSTTSDLLKAPKCAIYYSMDYCHI